MAELSLRKQIAYDKWLMGSPDSPDTRKGWSEALNQDYWLKQADSIISLMLAKVDKVKNPYFNRGGYDDTASSVGFNEALQAIKSILEGK